MSESLNWKRIGETLFFVTYSISKEAEAYTKEEQVLSKNTSTLNTYGLFCDNALMALPYEVRESITKEFYEPGMTSVLERYILNNILYKKNNLQNLMTGLFKYATRKNSHMLEWNTLVVLSELPYIELGDWADTLAVAATRSQFMDVVEMGVRCFENWENIEACEFLKNCKFEEKWLQEYADQVYTYVMEEGWRRNVLSTENYSWKVAEGVRNDSENKFERYSRGYSTNRV